MIPVEPVLVSAPETIFAHGVTLSSSNLSWPNVAASVNRPPKDEFRVVVAIKPAKANKEMDRMTMAIKISINVKPFGVKACFKFRLHKVSFVN